uniref:Uncharacterized protein n=1 Tax=Bionectria ochroleuca TaxID=29856 RepID=A0A8H7NA45_BIOOC
MVDDAALIAAAQIIATIAAEPKTPLSVPATLTNKIQLPGHDTHAKRNLEIELQKLALRVSHLENRATPTITFPETPNEGTESLFGDDSNGASRNNGGRPKGLPPQYASIETPIGFPRQLTKEALEGLREHVDDQSKLLDSQRQELAGVNAQFLSRSSCKKRHLNYSSRSALRRWRENYGNTKRPTRPSKRLYVKSERLSPPWLRET